MQLDDLMATTAIRNEERKESFKLVITLVNVDNNSAPFSLTTLTAIRKRGRVNISRDNLDEELVKDESAMNYPFLFDCLSINQKRYVEDWCDNSPNISLVNKKLVQKALFPREKINSSSMR